MKKIVFVIAVQLSHFLHAAASAGQQLQVDGNTITWDYENPVIAAMGFVSCNCASLAYVEGFVVENEAVSNFQSKIIANRKTVLEKTTNLPDAMKKRAVEFFDGVVKRVNCAYADLLQAASVLAPKQAALLGFNATAESTYLDFPEPIGSNSVPRGKEQEACDLLKELLNLDARYQKEKALLVGVCTINAQQLLMFITGAKQVVQNGKVIVANQFVQDLYVAYANPNFEQPHQVCYAIMRVCL